MKHIKNTNELKSFLGDFLGELTQKKSATIIALSGDLGAGKTTLVQSAAEFFKISETITSPTFVIQKEYEIEDHLFFKKMIHIDAYRLENAAELEYLGWNEVITNPENIIFIEWPEQVKGIEMLDSININIKISENDSREITIN